MSGSGWNRGTGATKPAPQKKPGVMRGAIAGLAVVAVLGVAAFFIFGGKDAKPKAEKVEKKPAQLAEVKPAAAPHIEKVSAEAAAKSARREKLMKMTPEERADFVLQELKNRPLNLSVSTNHTFSTGTEQVMSWVFTTRLGDMPPMLPKLPKSEMLHLTEILIADNQEFDSDPEKVRNSKQVVLQVKKELREYIKQGGEVEDFLSYYHDQLRQAHEEWITCGKSVREMCLKDPELAQDYCKEVNKRLESKGIKPVKLPIGLLRKQGVEVIKEN